MKEITFKVESTIRLPKGSEASIVEERRPLGVESDLKDLVVTGIRVPSDVGKNFDLVSVRIGILYAWPRWELGTDFKHPGHRRLTNPEKLDFQPLEWALGDRFEVRVKSRGDMRFRCYVVATEAT